jgi:hypothetical protein
MVVIGEQVQVVQRLSEIFGKVKSDRSRILVGCVSEDELEVFQDSYGKYIDELLLAVLKKAYNLGLEKEDFYDLLWKTVINTNFFNSIKERAFALYYMVIDRRLPYYPLEKGMLMEGQIFRKILKQNEETINRIKFILYLQFSQKTEEASLILKELVKLTSIEDQVIVLAAMLDIMRQEERRLRKRIRELDDEME